MYTRLVVPLRLHAKARTNTWKSSMLRNTGFLVDMFFSILLCALCIYLNLFWLYFQEFACVSGFGLDIDSRYICRIISISFLK